MDSENNIQQTEAEQLKDQLLRCRADFENYKKRTVREIQDATNYGATKLILDLLPIYDNLDLALKNIQKNPTQDNSTYSQGIQITLESFHKILDKHNCKKIKTRDEVFNPNWHNALSTIQNADADNGMIYTEVRSGWVLNGRVIRPSDVIVVQNN